MTTHGLITAWRDPRITAAVPISTVNMGNPTGTPVKTLFIHGDQDPICHYSSARAAYDEIPWPKAFLTHLDQGHDPYVWADGITYPQTRAALVDWLRWALHDDPVARDRLPSDATAPGRTTWESAGTGPVR